MIHVMLDNSSKTVRDLPSWLDFVHQWQTTPNAETWLSGHGATSLCILTNPDRAFLIYLRDRDDSGFCIEQKILSEPVGCARFRLANGQVDEYPLNNTVTRAAAEKAMQVYFDSGDRDLDLPWIED